MSFFHIQFLTGKTLYRPKNIPIQIVFDVSLSMSSQDISPSRFDVAKHAVSTLMQSLN
ncbi:MAG: VWA domain-containing protein [bacterium]|nr:VWA domain-containing protein [bacterium]